MVEIIKSNILMDAGVNHGFTAGCDFSTKEGFAVLQQELQLDAPLFKVKQVHGNRVCITSEMSSVAWTDPGNEEADAIIADGSACIGVVTADCVPILLYCKNTGLTAAIHAGWKGLHKGIVRNTVKAMFLKGATSTSILCAIGPCICYNCYEVSSDVADLFPESSDPIAKSEGQFLLDLAQAAEVSLIGAGLSTARMNRLDLCTSCSDQGLYSYRRSGVDCGRQYAFICRP